MSCGVLMVNTDCVGCGSCLGLGYDFLESSPDGGVAVKPGTMLEKESEEYKNLEEICPVKAFELNQSQGEIGVLEDLIQQLKNCKGVEKPSTDRIKFNNKEYTVSLPVASGEYRYEYSSDSAAERAALHEFERAMYSQLDNIILNIITEYRVKKLKPYYTESIEDGSVYASCNEKVTKILNGIKKILGDKLPKDFAEINIYPNRDTTWKMLNKGELVSDELISSVRSEFDYPASQYDCYWDTDDMEVECGSDWRGNTKYKDKYCYQNLRGAFQELANDILTSCGYASEKIERQAKDAVEWLIKIYNDELKKVIDDKVSQAEKCIK